MCLDYNSCSIEIRYINAKPIVFYPKSFDIFLVKNDLILFTFYAATVYEIGFYIFKAHNEGLLRVLYFIAV